MSGRPDPATDAAPPPITPLRTPGTGKPNQQEIDAAQAAAARGDDRAVHHALQALGAAVRTALGDLPIPLLAVQTHFSLLHGTASPAAWAHALAGFHHDRPAPAADHGGGNFPGDAAAVLLARDAIRQARRGAAAARAAPIAASIALRPSTAPWAVLADRDDLLGLPACLDTWGRGRVGVGATVAMTGGEVVLLAPDEHAYAALCRLLSWRHEEPAGWRAWCDDRAAGLPLVGVVALVRDARDGARLARVGAEPWWRSGLRPEQRDAPFPIACAPLLPHLGGDRAAAPVLAAMRTRGTVAEEPGGDALVDLVGLPAAYAGWEDQLAAGAALRARCAYAPGAPGPDGQPVFHLPPLPTEFGDGDGDADAALRRLAEDGLARRYDAGARAAARERLERELAVIAGKRFAGYILTVWSIARGRRTCGRGSAASSIVCYCLGITNVDPIAYHLLFERFLAPERVDPPDIDVDFAWDERDEVLADTFRRFDPAHTAMVATHLHLHEDGALREAARAFGLADTAIGAIQARRADLARYGMLRDGDATPPPGPWPRVLAAARTLVGAPRHLGVHCGGVVITRTPIRELVPVHRAAKMIDDRPAAYAVPAIAWEKDGAEALGLIKIDLLGNRSLAVIRDCLDDLRADGVDARGIETAVGDGPTQELMRTGATMGCFYIESPAMRQLQAKVGSADFDRLVVHSSIIRPAGNGFIRTYIQRWHRWQESGGRISDEERRQWWPHEALARLLSESFGVLSYQEDVMLVAQEMAGFGSAEANQLRKALGRSDTAIRLRPLAGRFDAGCRANGVSREVIDHVWGMISSFAGYSFCKAHSASYAMVSFQCAWLKAHHPACFLARVIANEGGYYAASAYVEEARRLGVAIRAPCVARSRWKTAPEGRGALRLGFHLVKGLSRATAAAIEHERTARPFAGVRDLRQRTGAARDELDALLDAGALDALLPDLGPAQRAWVVGTAIRSPAAPSDPASGRAQLELDLTTPEDGHDPAPPPLPALGRGQVLVRRWAALGVLPEAHPLCLWRITARPPGRCRDVTAAGQGRRVALVARAITRKDVDATYLVDDAGRPLPAPRFEPMAFVTFEDETGLVETTWFPDTYARHGVLLERGEPLRLSGTVEVEFGYPTLRVDWAGRI